MSNKQVVVYGVLESTSDLRGVFVGHIHFKKLMKFRKIIEIFHCCMTWLHVNTQNHFKKQKDGTESV